MARVQIPITQITDDGVAPPAQVNGDGANDHFLADSGPNVFLEVENSDGAGAHQVTIVTPKQVEGLDVADVVKNIAASGKLLIGPLHTRLFGQGDGTVHVDVADASLRFRAYRL